jgi:hypothetical protein
MKLGAGWIEADELNRNYIWWWVIPFAKTHPVRSTASCSFTFIGWLGLHDVTCQGVWWRFPTEGGPLCIGFLPLLLSLPFSLCRFTVSKLRSQSQQRGYLQR